MEQQDFLDALNDYASISSMLKTHSYEEILAAASSVGQLTPEELEQYPMGGYSKGRTSGAYHFVLLDLLKNVEHYDWLYSRLEDEVSRRTFNSLMAYRLYPSQEFLKIAYDAEHPQYFDKSFFAHVCTAAMDTGISGTQTSRTTADGTLTKHRYTNSVRGASMA